MTENRLAPALPGAPAPPVQNAAGGSEKAVRAAALALIRRSKIALLGTQGEDGFVNIKAILNLKHRGLRQFWFSTNTSSKKVAQIKKDRRVGLYFVDEKNYEGLLLTGTMRILEDLKSRQMLWSEGFEVYYPLGVTDPDYTVLGFTTRQLNYYHGLKNITFAIE
jgi:general stress protein 26